LKIKIKNTDIQQIIKGEVLEFPKYSTQIMNLANQNSQGTRPKVVGQLSELIQQFDKKTISEWEEWYKEKMPTAIDDAVNKIYPMIDNLKKSIQEIDKSLVKVWVEDLIITKTFLGLKFQEAIINKVADIKNKSYRLANPNEESKGIDGFIGSTAVSIKPLSYKSKPNLGENIEMPIIFYDKKKDGISIEFNFQMI
jgi:hypothetical protein